MNIVNNQNTESNELEVWQNPEKKEQFDKNASEFQKKYEQKLKNILPNDLVWKISWLFELNWDINSSLDSLKNHWVSEKNIAIIKQNLLSNTEISKENLDNIFEEIKLNDKNENLNLKLWELIVDAVKKSEENNDDELFKTVQEAREIQKKWDIWQKTDMILKLENILWNWQKNNFENISKNTKKNDSWQNEEIIQPEVWDEKTTDDKFLFFNWEEKENWQIENNNQKIDYEDNYFVNILENLNLEPEKFEEIKEEIVKYPQEEQKDIFLDFVAKNTSWETRENIISKFEKKDNNIDEKNFENSDFSKDTKWFLNLDKDIWWLEILLAKNYIYLPNKESSEDFNKQKSLETVLKSTTSQILSKKSSDFKQVNSILISKIKSEKNLDLKYKYLKELHKNSLLDDAKFWNKSTESQKQIEENNDSKKEELKNKYLEIKGKLEKSQKENAPKNEIDKLQKDLEEVIKQAKELDAKEKNISQEWNIWALSNWGKQEKQKEENE